MIIFAILPHAARTSLKRRSSANLLVIVLPLGIFSAMEILCILTIANLVLFDNLGIDV